jgi:hypothetical protein
MAGTSGQLIEPDHFTPCSAIPGPAPSPSYLRAIAASQSLDLNATPQHRQLAPNWASGIHQPVRFTVDSRITPQN